MSEPVTVDRAITESVPASPKQRGPWWSIVVALAVALALLFAHYLTRS